MPRLSHRGLDAQKRTARGLVQMMVLGELSVDTAYQRQSVWTDAQRVAMVKSWLTGVPLPALILNNRNTLAWKRANGEVPAGQPVSVVIDGRQRLETAALWFGGKLAVPREWFEDDEVSPSADVLDPHSVRYTDLVESLQRHLALLICLLPVAEANVATVQEEAEVYLLVNSAGTSQTPADLERAARIARGE